MKHLQDKSEASSTRVRLLLIGGLLILLIAGFALLSWGSKEKTAERTAPTASLPPPRAVSTMNFDGVSQADLVEMTTFIDPEGRLWFVGIVNNFGDVDIGVSTVISLVDDAGNVVANGSGSLSAGSIRPGETAPFEISFSTPPKWATYEVTMLVEQAAPDLHYHDINILSVIAEPVDGGFEVAGEVKNYGEYESLGTTVVVILYDDAGKFAGTHWDWVDTKDIPPGATSSFKFVVEDFKLVGEPEEVHFLFDGLPNKPYPDGE